MSVLEKRLCDLAIQVPGAKAIFNELNLNYYSNGKQTLNAALTEAHLNPETIAAKLTALEQNEALTTNWQTASSLKLIAHLIDDFHEKHRSQFQQLISLSKQVTQDNSEHPLCPHQLESHLSQMQYDLEEHMIKEEAILFPMIMKGYYPSGPIAVMEAEHNEHANALEKLTELTQQFTAPEDACKNWQLLYVKTKEFYNDLKEHIHLENNILFTRS